MDSENGTNFRPLEARERKLLERLLEHHPFDGRDELRRQLDSTTARLIGEHNDNYGSIALFVSNPVPASVACSVPVEAEYLDEDGIPVWVLLHVKQGLLWELEICRADGLPLIASPVPERLEPFSKDYRALIEEAKAKAEKRNQGPGNVIIGGILEE
ncbi:MAG: hypothetical protein ABSH52_28620 [Terriglobia bacterium]|jgi:hypothetical protein